MNSRTVVSLVLMTSFILLSAGCMQPEPPAPTPTPAPVPATVPSTMATPLPTTKASVIPEPTQTLPPQWPLSFSVEKAGTYSTMIITHFDGGKGLMYILRMDVRVTRPDGTVEMKGIAKPAMGDTVEIPGTNGTDRVEVMATMANGNVYKVIDQQMPYKSR